MRPPIEISEFRNRERVGNRRTARRIRSRERFDECRHRHAVRAGPGEDDVPGRVTLGDHIAGSVAAVVERRVTEKPVGVHVGLLGADAANELQPAAEERGVRSQKAG